MYRQFVQEVEPAALVVEPRILRRIIRLDGRVQGLRQLVTRRETYPILRKRLLTLVESAEFGVSVPGDLPERLILISLSEDVDGEEGSGAAGGTPHLARPLFYACVRLELDNRWAQDPAGERVAAQRRKQLGDAVFAEIRSILLQDDRLFQSPSDLETYVEFVACYAEMRYFAPREMTCHFPGVQDWQRVDDIVRQDLDHRKVFDRLRRHGWQGILPRALTSRARYRRYPRLGSLSPWQEFRRLQMKAERAAAAGNPVKAALLHLTASCADLTHTVPKLIRRPTTAAGKTY